MKDGPNDVADDGPNQDFYSDGDCGLTEQDFWDAGEGPGLDAEFPPREKPE